ncbi:hypothetical protein [Blastococcus carthaginiensis]|uniref:hypothetical protein n=1 Tax=Blastococcus carthaginiensis TaxID=3050034 RepID=UPI00273FD249|nr:hypothetical protein [Blastococcus carthaginiensis]
MLLKGHLWIETALVDLIRADLELPDEWRELERLPFPSKVALARAQGTLHLGGEPLLALNAVRNKLAHNLEFEVDSAALARMLKAFPKVSPEDRAEDPNCAPFLPSTLTPDGQVAAVLREVVLSLLEHIWTLTSEVLKDRAAKMQRATDRLNALLQSDTSETE